ncbi:MAG TPA: formyltransferase family protein [Gemmatimonadales bacterium]|nr:formyltransferase family protein [Gemmatimonadales bacterium]
MTGATAPFCVLVLTVNRIGLDAAAEIARLPGVSRVAALTGPMALRKRPPLRKALRMWRYGGASAVLRGAAARGLRALRGEPPAARLAEYAAQRCPGVEYEHVADFHSASTLERVRALAPDLGVVVATPRLLPSLFRLPRLGSINLHFGHAPEYRGSAPAFWELYEGTPEVGLTVHWVNERLDQGDIILQERLPLDLMPPGDPMRYLTRYWREQLAPAGIRLLVTAVERLTQGPVPARAQDPARGRFFLRPTGRDKRELRRRVRARRVGARRAGRSTLTPSG